MIAGLGIDVCEISRIEKALEHPRFALRAFTEGERARIAQRGAKTAAGLFAAKEAVAKALGSGFDGFGLQDVEIQWDEAGRPPVPPDRRGGKAPDGPGRRLDLPLDHPRRGRCRGGGGHRSVALRPPGRRSAGGGNGRKWQAKNFCGQCVGKAKIRNNLTCASSDWHKAREAVRRGRMRPGGTHFPTPSPGSGRADRHSAGFPMGGTHEGIHEGEWVHETVPFRTAGCDAFGLPARRACRAGGCLQRDHFTVRRVQRTAQQHRTGRRGAQRRHGRARRDLLIQRRRRPPHRGRGLCGRRQRTRRGIHGRRRFSGRGHAVLGAQADGRHPVPGKEDLRKQVHRYVCGFRLGRHRHRL